jgi:hypothetical protein
MDVDVKRLLQDELVKEKINICKIRELCKENPGLIAASGLRHKIWSLLLLGEFQRESIDVNELQLESPTELCREQQVLEADVPRTRGDVEEFRSKLWRKNMTDILQSFCVNHNIQYKQGMNEILAIIVFAYFSERINVEHSLDHLSTEEIISDPDLFVQFVFDSRHTFADIYSTMSRLLAFGVKNLY